MDGGLRLAACVLQLTIATFGGHTVAGRLRSTGIYSFPIREAAPLAIRAVIGVLQGKP